MGFVSKGVKKRTGSTVSKFKQNYTKIGSVISTKGRMTGDCGSTRQVKLSKWSTPLSRDK